MATDAPLSAALDRYRTAIGALRQGDAAPYTNCWTLNDEAALYGAWGPIDKGWETIADRLKWVASRFTGGTDQVELTAVV